MKKCVSAFNSIRKGVTIGSRGGAYGAIAGGVVGAVVNGRNTLGCISGAVKLVKPIWEGAKTVVRKVVDVAKRVGSAIVSGVRTVGRWVSGLFGRRLLELPGSSALPSAHGSPKRSGPYVRFTSRRSLQQSEVVMTEEEAAEDPELAAALAEVASETELTSIGPHFLDALLNMDDVMVTGTVALSIQTCAGLRNISRFTDFGLDGDLEEFLQQLPANVSSMLPQVQQGVSLLQSWSSAAQERASLGMQVQLMDFEQNALACYLRGDCPTTSRAQLDQIKQLLLHRLEDQTFALLDVLAAQVRQFEYWSLSESRYTSGFPIERYDMGLGPQNFCAQLRAIQTNIQQDAKDQVSDVADSRREVSWVYHELSISDPTYRAVVQGLLADAAARRNATDSGWSFQFYQPVTRISLDLPPASQFWHASVRDAQAYVYPVPRARTQALTILEKQPSSVFFLEDGRRQASASHNTVQ